MTAQTEVRTYELFVFGDLIEAWHITADGSEALLACASKRGRRWLVPDLAGPDRDPDEPAGFRLKKDAIQRVRELATEALKAGEPS